MLKWSYIEKIGKAIEEFNKYRSPEANARLISRDVKSFIVEFTGPFCTTCGFYDYFDDLRIILEDSKLKSEIKEIEETDEGAIVKFNLINIRLLSHGMRKEEYTKVN